MPAGFTQRFNVQQLAENIIPFPQLMAESNSGWKEPAMILEKIYV